jgi:hypothetical protein
MAITIDDTTLRRIKSKLAYPLLDEGVLDDEELKIYSVKPALDEYFRWFPKQERLQQDVSGSFTVDFPDTYTYGIVDARLSPVTNGNINSITGNRILDIVTVNRYGGRYSYSDGIYGTRFHFSGINRAREVERQLRNMELGKTDNSRVIVIPEERKVGGYTSESATLSIIWAKWSEDFTDVRFERKEEVIELAQAYMLQHMSDVVGLISNPNIDLDIDAGELQSKAEDLREKVLESWKEFPKVVVLPKHTGLVW